VIVGDEDDLCLDGSVFLKRTAPTAALLVCRAPDTPSTARSRRRERRPRRPVAAAEAGRWLAHKPI